MKLLTTLNTFALKLDNFFRMPDGDVMSLLFNHTAVHSIPVLINSVSNMFAGIYGLEPISSVR